MPLPTILKQLAAVRDELTGVATLRRQQRAFRRSLDDHIANCIDRRLAELLEPVNARDQPNINSLNVRLWNLDLLALNVKAFGYQLARSIGEGLDPVGPAEPPSVEPGCKPCTQADIESDWFAHWCGVLGIKPLPHRKLWEFAWMLQTLHQAGQLRAGAKGLGFGCGIEPLASLFAARGMDVTITDLSPDDTRAISWAGTNQHAADLRQAHHPHLVDLPTFEQRVRSRNVDMNAIPSDLEGYDFCWSVCALEHLGSIELGSRFIENSLRTLRPGGLAVHTTEYNINPDGPTIDNWLTVYFQQRHIEELATRLRAQGHLVLPLHFDSGKGPLDRFIDLPPWHEGTMAALSAGAGDPLHLKVAGDGLACTCFGFAVTKAHGG